MPGVKGLTLQEATDQLQQQGLVVADPPQKRQTDASPPQTVLGQDPAPGTMVSRGQSVTLTIAVPIKQVEVPDLTCKNLADAQSALAAAQLQLGSKTTTTSDACPADTVVAQSIPAGQKVDRGTLVNVTLVSGPATITLEDYTCETFPSARNALEKLGLVVEYGGTSDPLPQCPNPNRISMQDPSAGSSVTVGDTVTLFTAAQPSASQSENP
jgi:serine/threonine-protein kinase